MPRERRAALLRVTATCAAIAATQPLPGLLYYVAWSSQEAALGPLLGFWTTPDWFVALPVLMLSLLWAYPRVSDNAVADAARFLLCYLAYALVAGTMTAARYLLSGEAEIGAILSAGLSAWGWSASSGAILVGALWPMVLLRRAAGREQHAAGTPSEGRTPDLRVRARHRGRSPSARRRRPSRAARARSW